MSTCREVTVSGSLGIPVAGPIRPQGSTGAAAVSGDEPLLTGEPGALRGGPGPSPQS